MISTGWQGDAIGDHVIADGCSGVACWHPPWTPRWVTRRESKVSTSPFISGFFLENFLVFFCLSDGVSWVVVGVGILVGFELRF